MKTDDILSATVEEYLETIYNMSMEDEIVIGARLAERFQVSAPTVTEMLKRLVRGGFIEMNNKRQVTLTEEGYQAAEAVLRRHRLTERFLVDMLGMQWHEVHEEACRLEHFISGSVEAHVISNLDHPVTCPHGNPIPGLVPNARAYIKDNHAVRLSSLPHGEKARILLVSEVVEDEEALILYMHEKGLTPGTRLTILAQAPERDASMVQTQPDEANGSDSEVKLLARDREVTISQFAASKLWVVPEKEASSL